MVEAHWQQYILYLCARVQTYFFVIFVYIHTVYWAQDFSYSLCNLWVHWWVSDGKEMYENWECSVLKWRYKHTQTKVVRKWQQKYEFQEESGKKVFILLILYSSPFVFVKKIWRFPVLILQFLHSDFVMAIFFCIYELRTVKPRSTQSPIDWQRERKEMEDIAYTHNRQITIHVEVELMPGLGAI